MRQVVRHASLKRVGCALVVSGLTAFGLATAASSTVASKATPKKVSGTITWAEPPAATPNYILPFESSQYSTVNNISQFQYLLYRPLYMFGSPQSTSPTLDEKQSTANLPVYSAKNSVATIKMKGWKWSNGETVNASDVLFFMNLMHAEKANWYSYVPGLFPDNVKSVTTTGTNTIKFTFTQSFNPTWLTYNELGQLSPLPAAWDVTSATAKAGSGGCATGTYGAAATDKACAAVYKFLTAQASSISTYDTNPLWGVVDGPWTIASSLGGSFSTTGAVTMVPNEKYSGPQKAQVAAFKEVPFTTDNAQYTALLGGNLDVGFLPSQDVTGNTTNALKAGPNNPRLAKSYYLSPWVLFGYNYAVLKFESNGQGGADGAIFKQLYFRQALQSLVDQTQIISKVLKGYGVPTYGPVPVLPKNPEVDSYETKNPYPYSVSKAKSLLTSHGWSVVANGTDACTKPGSGSSECGAGIPKGAKLNFSFSYPSGTVWQQQTAEIEQAAWKSVGINITATAGSFDTVVGDYAPPCTSAKTCTEQFGWWGGGWEYSPDYYPSGELLFATGAGSNSGNYSDATADKLIKATDDTNTNLDAYQNYLAKQLPAIWEPNADYEEVEIKNDLKGVAPQDPFANLFPEYWHFTK